MITFVQNYKKCKLICSYRTQISYLRVALWRGLWEWLQRGMRKGLGTMNIFITSIVIMVSQCIRMSKFTKLYTLNIYSVFYVNYVPIKLLKRENKNWNRPKPEKHSFSLSHEPVWIFFFNCQKKPSPNFR